jgi:peptide/nickel transport system substrate-binding protein
LKLRTGKRRVVALTAGALVAGAVALTLVVGATGAPVATNSISIRLPGDWANLDFQKTSLLPQINLITPTYDTLLNWAPRKRGQVSKLVPYIAQSWKLNSTATAITFRLTDKAKCQNGAKLTPSVAKASFDRYIANSPQLATTWGPGQYTVTANDKARTLTVTSSLPNNELIYGVGGNFIICPKGIQDPTILQEGTDGSGPYKLVSSAHGQQAVEQLWPDWTWGANGTTSKGMVPQIVFKPVDNETTAANLLLTGGLDIAQVAGPDVSRLITNKNFNVSISHQYLPYELEFNLRQNRLVGTSIPLRKAITMVIDEKAFNRVEFAGRGLPSTSVVTKDTKCYDPTTEKLRPRGSVADAQKVLTDAGFKLQGGNLIAPNGSEVKMTLLKLDIMGQGMEYIAGQVKQLGIDTTINTLPYTQWVGNALAGNWDLWINTLYPSYPAVGTVAGYISGPGYPNGFNSNGMVDDQIDQYRAAALAASTDKDECLNWAKFQQRFLTQSYLVPLSAPNSYTFVRKGIVYQAWSPGGGSGSFGSIAIPSIRVLK